MTSLQELIKKAIQFDDEDAISAGKALLPMVFDEGLADEYASHFMSMEYMYRNTPIADVFGASDFIDRALSKSVPLISAEAMQKAVPPAMQSYSSMSYQPEQYTSGTLTWPGIPPQSISKIVQDNLAPQLILGMRVDDVLSYAQHSTQPWKPGWSIEPRWSGMEVSKAMRKNIREAEEFIMNSSIDIKDPMSRVKKQLMGFQEMLAAMTRDSLTYDGIALWTERDRQGKIISYKPLPAGNIRLVDPLTGYQGDKEIFAVAIDELGNVMHTFKHDDLWWYVRNPRLDVGVHQYGYSEIEVGIRMIQGYSNALGLNLDKFNKSATPNGILKLSGAWNQRQLDFMNRLWMNLKRGMTKSWVLPVVRLPDEGDIELMDLSAISGMETLYGDFINMLMGGFCAVYRFPPHRLGYRTSGMQGDNAKTTDTNKDSIVDNTDIGLIALLTHFENVLNDALIWSRWPDLKFHFQGKNPREDARQYEAQYQAMTYGERRAAAGQLPLRDIAPTSELKDIADILSMAPGDPAYGSIYQTALSAKGLGGQARQSPGQGPVNPEIQPKRDPQKGVDHGHEAGVRRETRRDAKNAGKG